MDGGNGWRRATYPSIAVRHPSSISTAMSFLDDIDFPASKIDVIAVAAEHGVSQEVLEALQRTREERFEDPSQVEAALASEA